MKQKQILIISIIVILAILACLTTFLIVNSNQGDYTTLRVSNSCTIDVPNVNNTMEHMSGGISKYLFSSVDLNITHQKSENNTQLKSINNESLKNSQKVDNDIYRDNTSGVYSAFIENKNTGDALLITSSNLDLLKKVKNNYQNSGGLTFPPNLYQYYTKIDIITQIFKISNSSILVLFYNQLCVRHSVQIHQYAQLLYT